MLIASIVDRLGTVGIPISEKIARTVIVYLTILVLLRMFGKRTAAQLNTFDLVVLFLLSNVVQNAIIGPDTSVLGGVIGAATLVAGNDLIVRLIRRSSAIDRALEGSKARLVDHGTFEEPELRRLGIRRNDLEVALRRQGAEHVGEVKRADLFPSGAIVVDLDPAAHSASVADVARLEAKLDRVLAAMEGSA